MFKQVIAVIAILCFLVPLLPFVFYERGLQSAPINFKPIAGKTPPCGNYGQAKCITHNPPANQRKNPCNRADLCRGAVSESMSEAQASMATKMVQDHALLQLALLMVLAWEMLTGLYELLNEFCKELCKLIQKEAKKRTKAQKSYDSDEDKNCKEAELSSLLDDCQKQIKTIGSEEQISERGLCVFGPQKTTPPLSFPENGSRSVLQSFMSNELKTLVGLVTQQVLYSSKEKLSSSACDFWCAILSLKIQVGVPPIEINRYPSYSELKSALETYGFLFNFSSKIYVNSSVCEVPPQNIIIWIKFTDVCCQVRCKHSVLLSPDCQELAEVIICLYLDQQLEGLSVLTRSCTQTVISLLAEEEWINSCCKIAKSLVSRVPMDLKCLQAVQCISEVDPRTQHLKNAVASQILVNCFGNKIFSSTNIVMIQYCFSGTDAIDDANSSCDVIASIQNMDKSVFLLCRRYLTRLSARFKSQGREPAAENLFEIDDVKFAASQQLEDGRESAWSWSNSIRFIDYNGHCNPRAETQTLTRSSFGRPAGKAVEKVQSYKEVPVNVKLLRNN